MDNKKDNKEKINYIKKLSDFIEKRLGYKTFLTMSLGVGIFLVAISTFAGDFSFTSGKSITANAEVSESETDSEISYKEALEEQLTDILKSIDGVGDVKVMIHLASGKEQVPVFNENTQTTDTKETDTSGGERNIESNNKDKSAVMTTENGTNVPFISKENNPEITGVMITAQGAENEVLNKVIKKTVVELFDLSFNKVNVHSMKGEK